MSADMLGEEFRFGAYYEVPITGDKVLDAATAKRAKVIKIVGTLTAAAIITMPRVAGGDWDVINGTTGGYNLTFKASTGTGVVVGAGTAARIVDEGDKFTAIATATVGAYAPSSAEYLVGVTNGSLSAGRVPQTTQTIGYDNTSANQARWNLTANWGAFSWTSTGTATLTNVVVASTTASQYVKTGAGKELVTIAKIPTADLTVTGGANGDIFWFNGTDVVRLAAGTNGHVLTLAGGVPTWAAPTGGAPTNAQFLVLANDGTLTTERALVFNTTYFSVTDAGANGSYTVAATGVFGTLTVRSLEQQISVNGLAADTNYAKSKFYVFQTTNATVLDLLTLTPPANGLVDLVVTVTCRRGTAEFYRADVSASFSVAATVVTQIDTTLTSNKRPSSSTLPGITITTAAGAIKVSFTGRAAETWDGDATITLQVKD